MHDFLSVRSWIIFVFAEIVLAGVLLTMDAFSGPLLILLGVDGLALLWAYERQPTWLPQRITRWRLKPLMSMDEVARLFMDRLDYSALTGPAIRAFLREGRITAYGSPIVGDWDPGAGRHPLGTEVAIPAKYWDEAEPQWTSHNVSAKTRHLSGGLEYGLVRFVRDDVMRCYFGGAPPMSRDGPV